MEALPVVSMDCSADGLLRCLLCATHSSHGLLAFRLTAEAAEALQQLRSRATVRRGSEQTGKSLQIRAHRTWAVGNLKWVVLQREGIPCDQQRILYAGKELETHLTLEDYNITDGSKLDLVLRLKGD